MRDNQRIARSLSWRKNATREKEKSLGSAARAVNGLLCARARATCLLTLRCIFCTCPSRIFSILVSRYANVYRVTMLIPSYVCIYMNSNFVYFHFFLDNSFWTFLCLCLRYFERFIIEFVYVLHYWMVKHRWSSRTSSYTLRMIRPTWKYPFRI